MEAILQTKRLLLTKITLDFKEDMFQLHSDPEVQALTGEPIVDSLEEVERRIKTRLVDFEKYGYGRMAVIHKESNAFVGWAGLAYLPEFDKVDIGYRFLKPFWGKGYATEVSKAILEHGFNVLKLDEIIAIALPENKASIRVMEKIGMQFDKIAPYDEEILEAVWYRLSKQKYFGV